MTHFEVRAISTTAGIERLCKRLYMRVDSIVQASFSALGQGCVLAQWENMSVEEYVEFNKAFSDMKHAKVPIEAVAVCADLNLNLHSPTNENLPCHIDDLCGTAADRTNADAS